MTTVREGAVIPALNTYAAGPLAELWKRPALNPRDRSIVTLAALIARNQTIELSHYLNVALDSGVKTREIAEIITHLALGLSFGGRADGLGLVCYNSLDGAA